MNVRQLMRKIERNEVILFENPVWYGPLLVVGQHWPIRRMLDACISAIDKHGDIPVYFIKLTEHEQMMENLNKQLEKLNDRSR